jgi:hypothetical protein
MYIIMERKSLTPVNSLIQKYREFFDSPRFNIECGDGWNEDVYPELESKTTSSFTY